MVQYCPYREDLSPTSVQLTCLVTVQFSSGLTERGGVGQGLQPSVDPTLRPGMVRDQAVAEGRTVLDPGQGQGRGGVPVLGALGSLH